MIKALIGKLSPYVRAIKIATAVAALSGAFWLAWSWQGSRCDADALKTALRASQAESENLRNEVSALRRISDATQKIAAVREDQRENAQRLAHSLAAEIEALKNAQPDCMAVPLHPDLRERVRESLR